MPEGVYSEKWSAEAEATLRRMWDEGAVARVIAPIVGFTRKAVQAKANRMKLARRIDWKKGDVWPAERLARLRELWPTMATAREIGLELGVTRNAVIGQAGRLGLPKRDSAVYGSIANAGRKMHPTGTGRYAGQEARKRERKAGAPRAARPKKVAPPKLRVYREFCGPPAPPPGLDNAKVLVLRGHSECAWPVYEGSAGHLFCCAPTAGKSSYCGHHKAMSIGRQPRPYGFTSTMASAQSGRPVWSEAA